VQTTVIDRPEPRDKCSNLLRVVATATALLALSVLPVGSAIARGAPAATDIADSQLLLVREALQVVRTVGDGLWPGWSRSSKATLIIDETAEYLMNYPETDPPPGFQLTSRRFMGRAIYRRPRQLPSTLRTAFPIAGIPAAVVGSWRTDVESPNEWVVTLVEQWFRVMQLDHGEQRKVDGLHLTDHEIPAWQLNMTFPFDDPEVGNALLLLGQALYDFWATGARLPREGQRDFSAETAWAALQNLRTVVRLKYGDQAYKYFQLQTWREGVARYSGIVAAREVARAEILNDYVEVRGFDKLPEHQSYAQMWEENLSSRFWLIRTSGQPGERDRTTFPAIGHGIAELLDAINPHWKERYFEPGVWLDDLVAERLAGNKAAER